MELWVEALLNMFKPTTMLWIMIGGFIGLVFGALPGIGTSLTLTLLLPLTFHLPPLVGLPMLIVAWESCVVGGSISSILLNTPGTGGNVATCFDGFPLAEQGKARVALGIATASSMIGGILVTILLYFGLRFFSRIILLFGPAEIFLLAVAGLCLLSVTTKGAALKGLIVAGVGLLISSIGFDIISGFTRFTWGMDYLYEGIPYITIVIGLFAVARMLELVTEKEQVSETGKLEGSLLEGLLVPFRYLRTVLRSCTIGAIIGFIPGLGVTSASLIAYGMARDSAPNPEEFGKGAYEGVVASEVANNAVKGGALIPGLSLGIPGNTDTAVFLVGLMMYGIRPGSDLFATNAHLVYLLIVASIVAHFVYCFQISLFSSIFAKITTLPLGILAPIVLLIALTGAYTLQNNIWDVIFALVFGIIGYGMIKLKYPVVPFLMAVILGPTIEANYGRALLISGGSYSIFFSSVLSKVLVVAIALSLLLPFLQSLFTERLGRKVQA
jgi:putative tricarboxylic transport membrane protein